jgi:hypothetical protein
LKPSDRCQKLQIASDVAYQSQSTFQPRVKSSFEF